MKGTQKQQSHPPVLATIWQDAWAAISSPRRYPAWALQPFSRSVRYLLAISAFIAVLVSLYALVALRPRVEAFGLWAVEHLPVIVFEDGILRTVNDETFAASDSDTFFLKIDPTISAEDEPHIDNFYELGYLFTSDQIIFQAGHEETATDYAELSLPSFTIDGQSIQRWTAERYTVFALTTLPVIAFVIVFLFQFIISAVFAFLMFLGSFFRANFEHCWNMAIYAHTPAMAASYLVFVFAPGLQIYMLVYLAYLILGYIAYRRVFQS